MATAGSAVTCSSRDTSPTLSKAATEAASTPGLYQPAHRAGVSQHSGGISSVPG
jgi:hypothetical protein